MGRMVAGSKIREARNLINRGFSVKQAAEQLKVSESWVRSYTKSERKSAKADPYGWAYK